MSTQLADLIRHRRMQRGLSARALSLDTKHGASYVSKLEAGAIEPSFSSFARLVTRLEFSPAEVALVVALEARDGQ